MTADVFALREALPAEMVEAKRWLLHDVNKHPFYTNGVPRNGTLDTPEDVANFATFGDAVAAFEGGGRSICGTRVRTRRRLAGHRP